MYIGIDLGGTNIAVGIVDDDARVICKASTPTLAGRSYKEIVKDMSALCSRLISEAGLNMSDIKAAGIGSPGTVDSENGVVVFSGNLKFKKVPMAGELKSYLHIPVFMENDANAAAYGEYMVCDKSIKNFVLVTLGTGVGGGIIINRKIYRGFNSAGAEIGHITLIKGGIPCTCGRKGCFERYASVTALIQQTKASIEKNPNSMMCEWVKNNGRINGKTAFECAAKGDAAAIEVRDKYIEYIAEGITDIVNIFQPEMLKIGGGISREGDVILKPLKEYVYKYDFNKYMPKTQIEIAALFNDAGIVGAAMAAKNALPR